MWWIALWFIVEGVCNCIEIYKNCVTMVTYLDVNKLNVQCHGLGDFVLTSHDVFPVCYSYLNNMILSNTFIYKF